MFEKNTIARPYAKALFEIACNDNELDQWSASLAQLALVTQDHQMIALLGHPNFSVQDSLDLIFSLMTDVSSKIKTAIICIGTAKRLLFVPQIMALFEVMKKESQKIVDVTMVMATPLQDEAFKEKMRLALKQRFKQDIALQFEIDESLIGGAIIKAGDIVIDGSLHGRLTRLRDALGV